MLKIHDCPLSRFQNEEHYMYQTEFNGLIVIFTVASLLIATEYETYFPLYTDEGEALNFVRKSNYSEMLHATDVLRDNTIDGMDDAIKSGLRHFNPAIREASIRLKTLRDTSGDITKKSYDKESASVIKLLADLKGPYALDVKTTGIGEWATELETKNNDFLSMQKSRYDEKDEKTRLRMKQVRRNVDNGYHGIVEKINALIIVNGEAPYVDFVNKLNLRIDEYTNKLAIYKGRAKNPPSSTQDMKV